MSPAMGTYRLQFNKDFRFEDARALVPYLSRLGITHLYSSPILRSRSDSSHGYDVVDPATLNPNLGDETNFRDLVNTLHAHGLGLLVDIVPNHMAASSENPYWQNILTYGQNSPYSTWFDIDWRLPSPELWGRVVVPILGEPLPRILSNDQIELQWAEGRFTVHYYDHVFPLYPATVPMICRFGLEDLEQTLHADHPVLKEMRSLLEWLEALPRRTRRSRRTEIPIEDSEQALSRLAQLIEQAPQIHDWAVRTAHRFTEGDAGRRRLKKLLGYQFYRLVYWRRAARVINYRRFFDINDLISVRQEDPEVFTETHAAIARWLREGLLDGLRIDHIDGLRDPLGYLRRLQELSETREQAAYPFRVYVEKILAPDESLPERWPVDGTTGYEFLNQVEDLFISREGFEEVVQNYLHIMRRPLTFEDAATWGKRHVLKTALSAFVGRLADILLRLAHYDSRLADLTKRELVDALIEFVVALPVYRTYIDTETDQPRSADYNVIEQALATARNSHRAAPRAMDFLEEVLLLKRQHEVPENEQQERLNFIQRFQQLTGPAAAKGIEDTALYIYVPLASKNEVGGEPHPPPEDAVCSLHRANEFRAEKYPHNLLGLTTHDTKRSSDVRARLDVLSEVPKLWFGYVQRWMKAHRKFRKRVRSKKVAPDRATEYLFYQSLVGVWPAAIPNRLEEDFPDPDALAELRERLLQYMLKAVREAKTRTKWVDGDPEYEEGLLEFIRAVMPIDITCPFLRDVHEFVARIARLGFWNSLSRVLIQYTAPGVPDLYQGDEMWNFSLVDPDNRRRVDYQRRKHALDDILTHMEGPIEDREVFLRQLVSGPEDGRIKLHLVRSLLHARRNYPHIFNEGDYRPLEMEGEHARHAFAFARTVGDAAAIAVVPRLIAPLAENSKPPLGEATWGDTYLHLPASLRDLNWVSVLTGDTIVAGDPARFPLGFLFNTLPVALLVYAGASEEEEGQPGESVPWTPA